MPAPAAPPSASDDPLASLLARLYGLRRDGRAAEAAQLRAMLTARAGSDPRLWAGLAAVHGRLGERGAAVEALRRAAALAPGDLAIRVELCRALVVDARFGEAAAPIDSLAAAEPAAPALSAAVGALLMAAGRPERALAPLRRAIEAQPQDARALSALAACERQLGGLDEADAHAAEALRRDPGLAEALWLRADLGLAPAGELERALEDRLAARPEPAAAATVLYALGKLHERRGRWPEAFDSVRRGAAAKRSLLRYDPAADEALYAALGTAHPVARSSSSGLGEQAIFVVGLPRTGTTLVERILAAHSAVVSLGEPPALDRVLFDVAGAAGLRGERAAREGALGLDLERIGRGYLDEVARAYAPPVRFIDKRPLNMLNVGLIRAALPGARIVLVERDPMDAAWAAYKTLFAGEAYPWSYDLDELAAQLIRHHRLAARWRAAFGEAVLRLRYEDVVADLEGQARRLVAHCGLAWEDACLAFHENAAPALTASAVEVRRPVHDRSVGLWRRYAEGLAPVQERLRAAGLEAH